MRDISERINVSTSTVFRLKQFVSKNDEASLQKMLNASTCKAGSPSVLSNEEEKMIVERFIVAAKRGFAGGKDALITMMA